ncbi:LEAF RUST 10 DISEASE-RESISTANCE LOCUS RECEPTOR-LIKE PROTEIN KINASE-like [Canna indica]|uniref:LEAF RUST 10 DISEASE-RESISTANCE LOCUS RECEPTOR-LIKE PROTEIN KINASE-like n=1 Tax=Canna indica TaxID=4628 RepID=A0AAQ3Q818_9LILI|nr:LEAF RUST 10 DISEASE-RESISTANCE LOCUS RECEPTOR-LIKE PROTEIN KINASE-like [Canna indica]
MPTPPLFFLCLVASLLSAAVAVTAHPRQACSPPPSTTSSPSGGQPCPPFPSPPHSFPFASSPGCGHPFFQVKCSAPHSTISINSVTFLLLDLPSNSSLLLSPLLPSSNSSACPALPDAAINLSGSPFHLSHDVCSFLAAPRRCSHQRSSSSPACRRSSWQSRLLSRPELLFHACSNGRVAPSLPPSPVAAAGCQTDEEVAVAIFAFLRRGFLVKWDPSTDPYFAKCSSCRHAAAGACGFNDSASGRPFLCFPSSEHLQRAGSFGPRRFLLVAAALFASGCVVLLFLSFWAAAVSLRRRRRGSDPGSDSMTAFLLRHHLHPPIYTYDQLRASTDSFDPRRKIGDGGFGSVYLAHLDDGRVAAVKRLHRHHPAAAATKSFCNEILILSSLRHPNLVRLHGYCCDPRGLLLVYDYVPNGTLADHLHGSRGPYSKSRALPWAIRLDIALQTAAALEYLHFALKPPVVHRDITSSNIFVERDMRVKVGDFGLSRLLTLSEPSSSLGSSTEYVCCTGPQGTPGYLDPEYHRSFRLTEKSDVYSFGVVLLELVTGMKAVDVSRHRSEMALVDMVVSKIHVGALHQVVDPALLQEGKEVMAMVEAVVELAFRCVAGDKDDRPDARELVEELKRIRSKIIDPPKGP